jgi:hypothetical protein
VRVSFQVVPWSLSDTSAAAVVGCGHGNADAPRHARHHRRRPTTQPLDTVGPNARPSPLAPLRPASPRTPVASTNGSMPRWRRGPSWPGWWPRPCPSRPTSPLATARHRRRPRAPHRSRRRARALTARRRDHLGSTATPRSRPGPRSADTRPTASRRRVAREVHGVFRLSLTLRARHHNQRGDSERVRRPRVQSGESRRRSRAVA